MITETKTQNPPLPEPAEHFILVGLGWKRVTAQEYAESHRQKLALYTEDQMRAALQSVDLLKGAFRAKLLQDVNFLPKLIFACNEPPHQNWEFRLTLPTPPGVDDFSPTLTPEQCLDVWLGELLSEGGARPEQSSTVDYTWKTVEDYERDTGYTINNPVFHMGWNMARTTNTFLAALAGKEIK